MTYNGRWKGANMNIRNAIIVLEALAIGTPVEVGDEYPLAMGEDGSIGWLYNGRVVSELPTGTFIRLCNALSKEEVFLIAANVVLNELNKKSEAYRGNATETSNP